MTLHRSCGTKCKMYIELYKPTNFTQDDLCNFSEQACKMNLIIPVLPKKKPVVQLISGRATSQMQVCLTSGPLPFPFLNSFTCIFRSSPQGAYNPVDHKILRDSQRTTLRNV